MVQEEKSMHVKQSVDGKQPHAKTLVAKTWEKKHSHKVNMTSGPDLSSASVQLSDTVSVHTLKILVGFLCKYLRILCYTSVVS